MGWGTLGYGGGFEGGWVEEQKEFVMIQTRFEVRKGADRGTRDFGGLQARHSFSFGDYVDPHRMAYRTMRVLNDDVVQGGGGFPTHPHRNMEIITWVLDGTLEHADSTGQRGELVPGEVQVMTAGKGIRHSEANGSQVDPLRLLQIWIEPSEQGLTPAYAQKMMPHEQRDNAWQVIASGDGRGESLVIHQDAVIQVADLAAHKRIDAQVGSGRYAYLQVATGAVRVGDIELIEGDAVLWEDSGSVTVEADQASQIVLFDLA